MNKEDKKVEVTEQNSKKNVSVPKDVAVLGQGYEWWFDNKEDDVYDDKYRDKV
ncbi:hypothetical protein NDS46_16315 [Paenibacillus thiaminolyticus]|uniref:hypothetical protein n=1 Tax=Paenibacillus thiaminolyticus TaxID=49283 RepID=UPI00233113CD|nr:hypothetical protein [Paenibacillus thiaminolyticus]WCF05940.1 hypothetical protein NDS46_16315 [Paenibacillus thiaminolyticus]